MVLSAGCSAALCLPPVSPADRGGDMLDMLVMVAETGKGCLALQPVT